MEMCILEGMRDESLPGEVKSLLLRFNTELLQRRNEVQKVLESGMQGDKRTDALVTQRKKLFTQFEAFVNQTPQSRYRDLFKRQGYKCLMSLQNCQRSPMKAPEIAAFSRSLGAIAANIGDSALFGKLFHVIYTTLRDVNESPTPQVASLLADQCNEILSQHGHLLSPLVAKILKAQGEAAVKRVSESASESRGWLSQLVGTLSNLVHRSWGANVDGDSQAGQRPLTASKVTPFEIIASVDPALAGTISHFLKFVQAVLADVPLEKEQYVAFQCLLDSELYIADQLKKLPKDATRSDFETEIKQKFISRVNLVWPAVINNLRPEVLNALNEKYTDTFKILTQTSALRSLIQRVKKLTLDRRVQALVSFVFLSSLINGVEGAPIPEAAEAADYALTKVTQQEWDGFACHLFEVGYNTVFYWTRSRGPTELFACMKSPTSILDKATQLWRSFQTGQPQCVPGKYVQKKGSIIFDHNGKADPDPPLKVSDIDLNCKDSFKMKLKSFASETPYFYCRWAKTEGSPEKWQVPISSHPHHPFTYCVNPNAKVLDVVHKYHIATPEEAQFAQAQCRREVSSRQTEDGIPSSLLLRNTTIEYVKKEDALEWQDRNSDTWLHPCPEDIKALEAHPTKMKKTPEQTSAYVLGPPSPNVSSDKQSLVDVNGTLYGLYEETASGLVPIKNETFDTVANPPTSPATQNFSFPVYPAMILSESTAVAPIAEAATDSRYWQAALGVGGLATATAVVLYMYYRQQRPQISTHSLLEQYTGQCEGSPLDDFQLYENGETPQETTSLQGTTSPDMEVHCVTEVDNVSGGDGISVGGVFVTEQNVDDLTPPGSVCSLKSGLNSLLEHSSC
eukprot:Blabericola_migrator_1__4414@NODE_2369_length_2866_cov_13_314041_g1484_i0_p1_GENE_NODE_2369_length_2866_cov_13_314041_g1484_i0NODE_2369_length_2866_cov_13_314041_g1484_i0_p1_ORF_typecomplete_len851_score132_11Lactate_perm/PF02652_14/0_064Trns_repr_metal/PF02583_17/0_24_NODE_2369_length_2866_cov_13_314041_g1484_i01652717